MEQQQQLLEQKGAAYLDAVLAGGAAADAPLVPASAPVRTARAARRAVLDPDVLAMGTLLEHAGALGLFALFAVATSASLVLAQKALRALPGAPLTLLLAQLAFTAALCRASATHGLLPSSDAAWSTRRAAQAAPGAPSLRRRRWPAF